MFYERVPASSRRTGVPPVARMHRFNAPIHKGSLAVRNLSNPFAVGFAAGLRKETAMHGLIYLIGLIVVILAILSFFGLR